MSIKRVVFEIEIESDSDLLAAKEVVAMIKENGDNFQYYVQDAETLKVVSVDLEEDDNDAVLPVHEYHSLIEN